MALFRHALYINTLPPPASLRTPLHFTKEELEAFRGTNLHGAALDRRTTWEAEWRECRDLFSQHLLRSIAPRFTWSVPIPLLFMIANMILTSDPARRIGRCI